MRKLWWSRLPACEWSRVPARGGLPGRLLILLSLLLVSASAEDITVPGLREPVEVLRDRWGIPHIYAETQPDLFFAQGYIAARDRLFQLDLWRRIGTGRLAQVLGPQALDRDRIARLVSFRGDWNAEWLSYAPDAQQIAVSFTSGINAYIRSLGGKRPLEFRIVGYDPGTWQPEDVTARIAGLLMTRNIAREVRRSEDILELGLQTAQRHLPPDPFIKFEIPVGLNLAGITGALLRDYNNAIGSVQWPDEQGSNNWVVSGARSVTGKPLLASDPHRPVTVPSLRKTVHLIGPGWNVFGSGEPALPGIALGHNEDIGFGFTIVNIDQCDLYVEKLNPANLDEYEYRGAWRKMTVLREEVPVRGSRTPRRVELRFTVHGPVIAEDLGRHRAFALKWVGTEPGTAGYLAGLSLSRARNWSEFLDAAGRYKVPSENLVYGDREGNIGWTATGLTPLRKNWSGLLPVPGHEGRYEWSGFLPPSELPRIFNPASGWVATANQNILPAGYKHVLGYEWANRFRFQRVEEMLRAQPKFSVADFERMQQDVTSVPARRFQQVLRRWKYAGLTPRQSAVVERLRKWDLRITAESPEAMIYELWTSRLPRRVFGPQVGSRVDLPMLLDTLDKRVYSDALRESLAESLEDLTRLFGSDIHEWRWGRLHEVRFRHPLGVRQFHRGPISRPGDGNTVNATGGSNFRQSNGASWRMILDFDDWDKSVMTNVPGESGNPDSPHYSDLLEGWASGKYHPMLYSRRLIEQATVERIRLIPRGFSETISQGREDSRRRK
jgi:penicillin amidase